MGDSLVGAGFDGTGAGGGSDAVAVAASRSRRQRSRSPPIVRSIAQPQSTAPPTKNHVIAACASARIAVEDEHWRLNGLQPHAFGPGVTVSERLDGHRALPLGLKLDDLDDSVTCGYSTIRDDHPWRPVRLTGRCGT